MCFESRDVSISGTLPGILARTCPTLLSLHLLPVVQLPSQIVGSTMLGGGTKSLVSLQLTNTKHDFLSFPQLSQLQHLGLTFLGTVTFWEIFPRTDRSPSMDPEYVHLFEEGWIKHGPFDQVP